MVTRIRRDDPPKVRKPVTAARATSDNAPKPKPRAARVAARDELSNGRGSALRRRGLGITGGNLNPRQLEARGPGMSVSDVLASRWRRWRTTSTSPARS